MDKGRPAKQTDERKTRWAHRRVQDLTSRRGISDLQTTCFDADVGLSLIDTRKGRERYTMHGCICMYVYMYTHVRTRLYIYVYPPPPPWGHQACEKMIRVDTSKQSSVGGLSNCMLEFRCELEGDCLHTYACLLQCQCLRKKKTQTFFQNENFFLKNTTNFYDSLFSNNC